MEKRPSVRERMEAEERRLAGESEGGVQNMEVDVAAARCPGRRSESSAGNRPGRRSESPAGNLRGRRSLSIASERDAAEVTEPVIRRNMVPRKRTLSAAEKGKGVMQYTVKASQGGLMTPDIAEQEAYSAPPKEASDLGRTSLEGTKFIDSVTKLARKYDRRAKREAERAEQAAEEVRAKWEDEVAQRKVLDANMVLLERTRDELRDSGAQKDSEIELLKGQLELEKSSVDSKVKTATKKIVRSLMSKFKSKIERTKEKFRALGKSVNKMNDLAQVDANLELIRKLQREDAPTLEDESAKISKWRGEFVGGDTEYNALFTEIQQGLVVSPFSYDDSSTFDANPFENQAAGIGVHFPSGSNWNPSGVFLLDPRDIGAGFEGEPDGTENYGFDDGNAVETGADEVAARSDAGGGGTDVEEYEYDDGGDGDAAF